MTECKQSSSMSGMAALEIAAGPLMASTACPLMTSKAGPLMTSKAGPLMASMAGPGGGGGNGSCSNGTGGAGGMGGEALSLLTPRKEETKEGSGTEGGSWRSLSFFAGYQLGNTKGRKTGPAGRQPGV